MIFDIDRKDYDECEKTRTLIPEGQYLVEILDVEGTDASEYLAVKYRTMLPAPGMEGEERFFLSAKAMKRFRILAKRAVEHGVVANHRAGDPDGRVGIDPYDLVGSQWVAKIGHEQLEDKKGVPYTVSKWGFADFWPTNHPDVAEWMQALGQRSRPAPATQHQPTNGRQTVAAAATQDDEV